MATLLDMRAVSTVLPGVRALDQVNLTVEAGEIHVLCGETAAGKSTLMTVLSGVYPAYKMSKLHAVQALKGGGN